MQDPFYSWNTGLLFLATAALILCAAELGIRLGQATRRNNADREESGTLAGAILGLLALLLGFSFSLALSRFDNNRAFALREANAIGSTANFALMLEEPVRSSVLHLLREYAEVRVGLGVPYDPAKLDRDVARSLELQAALWQYAIAASVPAPQSLSVHRFVESLNEVNNLHTERLSALRYHVPGVVAVVLVTVAATGVGFTGYHAGLAGSRRRSPTMLMALLVCVVITLVADLDRPARGLIRVPVQTLIDTVNTMPR
jgi:hypothetical protein